MAAGGGDRHFLGVGVDLVVEGHRRGVDRLAGFGAGRIRGHGGDRRVHDDLMAFRLPFAHGAGERRGGRAVVVSPGPLGFAVDGVMIQELNVHRQRTAVQVGKRPVHFRHNGLEHIRSAAVVLKLAQNASQIHSGHRDLCIAVQRQHAVAQRQRRSGRQEDLDWRLRCIHARAQLQRRADLCHQAFRVVDVVNPQIALALELQLLRADLHVGTVLDQHVAVVIRLRRRRQLRRQRLPRCPRLSRVRGHQIGVVILACVLLHVTGQLVAVGIAVDLALDRQLVQRKQVLEISIKLYVRISTGLDRHRIASRTHDAQTCYVGHLQKDRCKRRVHRRVRRNDQRREIVIKRRAGYLYPGRIRDRGEELSGKGLLLNLVALRAVRHLRQRAVLGYVPDRLLPVVAGGGDHGIREFLGQGLIREELGVVFAVRVGAAVVCLDAGLRAGGGNLRYELRSVDVGAADPEVAAEFLPGLARARLEVNHYIPCVIGGDCILVIHTVGIPGSDLAVLHLDDLDLLPLGQSGNQLIFVLIALVYAEQLFRVDAVNVPFRPDQIIAVHQKLDVLHPSQLSVATGAVGHHVAFARNAGGGFDDILGDRIAGQMSKRGEGELLVGLLLGQALVGKLLVGQRTALGNTVIVGGEAGLRTCGFHGGDKLNVVHMGVVHQLVQGHGLLGASIIAEPGVVAGVGILKGYVIAGNDCVSVSDGNCVRIRIFRRLKGIIVGFCADIFSACGLDTVTAIHRFDGKHGGFGVCVRDNLFEVGIERNGNAVACLIQILQAAVEGQLAGLVDDQVLPVGEGFGRGDFLKVLVAEIGEEDELRLGLEGIAVRGEGGGIGDALVAGHTGDLAVLGDLVQLVAGADDLGGAGAVIVGPGVGGRAPGVAQGIADGAVIGPVVQDADVMVGFRVVAVGIGVGVELPDLGVAGAGGGAVIVVQIEHGAAVGLVLGGQGEVAGLAAGSRNQEAVAVVRDVQFELVIVVGGGVAFFLIGNGAVAHVGEVRTVIPAAHDVAGVAPGPDAELLLVVGGLVDHVDVHVVWLRIFQFGSGKESHRKLLMVTSLISVDCEAVIIFQGLIFLALIRSFFAVNDYGVVRLFLLAGTFRGNVPQAEIGLCGQCQAICIIGIGIDSRSQIPAAGFQIEVGIVGVNHSELQGFRFSSGVIAQNAFLVVDRGRGQLIARRCTAHGAFGVRIVDHDPFTACKLRIRLIHRLLADVADVVVSLIHVADHGDVFGLGLAADDALGGAGGRGCLNAFVPGVGVGGLATGIKLVDRKIT